MEQIPNMYNVDKKEDFFNSLKEEVDSLVEEGRLTEEQAKNKIEAAGKIEDNIPDDTKKAARIFAVSGIASEEELTDLFKK